MQETLSLGNLVRLLKIYLFFQTVILSTRRSCHFFVEIKHLRGSFSLQLSGVFAVTKGIALSDYDALLEETQVGNEYENMSYDMIHLGIPPDKPICKYI